MHCLLANNFNVDRDGDRDGKALLTQLRTCAWKMAWSLSNNFRHLQAGVLSKGNFSLCIKLLFCGKHARPASASWHLFARHTLHSCGPVLYLRSLGLHLLHHHDKIWSELEAQALEKISNTGKILGEHLWLYDYGYDCVIIFSGSGVRKTQRHLPCALCGARLNFDLLTAACLAATSCSSLACVQQTKFIDMNYRLPTEKA